MNNTIYKLNRFTTLPVLLDLLERQKLVLLDPKSWDDRNDTEVILTYKRKAAISKLFALCFSHSSETIHHWKTYANGSSGCCIEFSARKLMEIFDNTPGLRHGKVTYKTINEVQTSFPLSEMPFIKRKPYECEREYRAIWEGDSPNDCFELDVPLSTINRITISQQMPEQVFKTLKQLLKTSSPNKVNRSTIYENKIWISRFG